MKTKQGNQSPLIFFQNGHKFFGKISYANILSKIISGQTDELCRVCLGETSRGFVHMHDSVLLQDDNKTESILLGSILRKLFGIEFIEDQEEAFPICTTCSKTAVESYMFIKIYQKSTDTLLKLVDSVHNCIPSVFDSIPKTLYLILKEQPMIILDKKAEVSSTKEACSRLKTLQRNKVTKAGDKAKFVCRKCKEEFLNKFDLAEHLLKHKDLRCDKCIKAFRTPWQLSEHIKRTHSELIYDCPHCNKKLGSIVHLNEHIRLTHTKCICKICGKECSSKIFLRHHEDSHTIKVCPQCGRKYKTDQTFRRHVANCSDEKMDKHFRTQKALFFCDHCGKGYTQKCSLISHIKSTHEDINPFACKWCSKKFNAKSRLKAHIVKHTRVRDFYCELCGGSFVTKEALLYHTRRHTGETPYACTEENCKESFISASRRMEHIRKKHKPPSFACKICPSAFYSGFALKKHTERHYDPNSKLYNNTFILS